MEGTELTQFTSVVGGILRCSFKKSLNIQSVFHAQT